MIRNILVWLVATSYCTEWSGNVHVAAVDTSNQGYLAGQQRLSTFVDLLAKIGLSAGDGKTLFAPTNQAWENAKNDDPLVWKRYTEQSEFVVHLIHLVNHHFATEEKLNTAEIWDGAREEIKNGIHNITITQNPAQLEAVSRNAIVDANIETTDGIVHVMDQVIWPPYLRDGFVNQLFEDQSWKFAFTTMANLILHVGMEDEIDAIYDHGITMLIPPNRRFNRAEIDIPELLTPQKFDYLVRFLKCHMIKYMHNTQSLWAKSTEENIEQWKLQTELGTDLWVTTSENQIRFQSEKTLLLDQPSRHGIFHVVDMPLEPPSIRHFTDFTWRSTDWDTSDCVKLFINTLTYSDRIAEELGTKLTMFCPTREAFDSFNREDWGRLLEPMWIRHAKEFLLNMITEGAHTRAELIAKAPSTITMLNGKTYDLRRTGDAVRIKNTAQEQARSYVGDLLATDGYLHMTDKVITPTAVSRSVYDQSMDNPDFQLVVLNIDFVDMQNMIDQDIPITFMAPYDTAWWRVRFPTLEGEEIIKRHLFRGLLFCDVIANQTTVTAVNGEIHSVELRGEKGENVFVGGAFIFNCDILARNGVLHHVDRVIGLDYDTEPPSISPSPTITPQPTISPQPTLNPAGPPPTSGSMPIYYQGYTRPISEEPDFDPDKYYSGVSPISLSLVSTVLLMVTTFYFI